MSSPKVIGGRKRYGPQQNARDRLRAERWSCRAAAQEIGVPYGHLVNALSGRTVPSPEVRVGLAELLSCSAEELFTAEALAATSQRRSSAKDVQ